MGSYKPYTRRKERKLISRMINSILYYFKYVFILVEGNHYRLVVIEEKEKIIDMKYKTLRGAKIACTLLLRKRTNIMGMKPVWSFLYPPDEKWLQDKLNRKKNHHTAPAASPSLHAAAP